MKKNVLLFIVNLILALANKANAQVDDEFWFVIPEISKSSPTILDSPIVFRIVTFESPATVTIEQPASGSSGMPTTTLTIPANTTQTFGLSSWLNILENRPANTILNKGI